MLDPMSAYVLAQLRHEELVREATADRQADEALALGSLPMKLRLPGWRQTALAWVPFVIARLRVATRLESPGG